MKDANFLLPHDLTPLVREHLDRLPESPRTDWLKEQVFSKFVSNETAPERVRRKAAVDKWLATELTNAETNLRLLTINEDFQILPRVEFADFMARVQGYCKDVLGDVPPVEVLFGSFSGGASTSRNRTVSHPARKYLGKADVTARASEWADEVLSSSPLWREFRDGLQFSIVEGNILFTVPKNTNIDRVACKEPDINMYLQKGVGDFIRRRLRSFGIDLNDQGRNRNLARKGSINNSLATIDLSSASDSITTELVFQCVPISWYVLLDSLRSHTTFIDGEPHKNEMFSSMGNGFTFELESLLFWAIAKAVAWFNRCERMSLSVYGDDIIVPTVIADQLIYALSFLGFKTNRSKSFTSGPFRESCGGHYWLGEDITPFYIKAPITRVLDVIHLCNSIRKWSERNWSILSSDLEDLWVELSSHVPKCFWGGFDLDSKFQLVTYWYPSKPRVLVPLSRKPRNLGRGGYLLWLNSKEDRADPGPMKGGSWVEPWRIIESARLGAFVQAPPAVSLQTSTDRVVYSKYASKRVYHDLRWRGSVYLHEVHPPISDATSDTG